jgi:hypothetical protein
VPAAGVRGRRQRPSQLRFTVASGVLVAEVTDTEESR